MFIKKSSDFSLWFSAFSPSTRWVLLPGTSVLWCVVPFCALRCWALRGRPCRRPWSPSPSGYVRHNSGSAVQPVVLLAYLEDFKEMVRYGSMMFNVQDLAACFHHCWYVWMPLIHWSVLRESEILIHPSSEKQNMLFGQETLRRLLESDQHSKIQFQ